MKIRITKPGIFGASGEIPIGAEFVVNGPLPEGWAGRYETITADTDAPLTADTDAPSMPMPKGRK